MRPLLLILLSVIVFVPSVAHAKRKAAPKVEPIIYEAMRYAAPNDDGRRAYLQAWDIKPNRMVWEITVFRNLINPLVEEDVQHVYINKMSIREGKLILIAEDDRAYSVDLKTRAVKRLKQPPAEMPQANHALQRTAAGRIMNNRSDERCTLSGCNRENGTTVTMSACVLSASPPPSLSLGR